MVGSMETRPQGWITDCEAPQQCQHYPHQLIGVTKSSFSQHTCHLPRPPFHSPNCTRLSIACSSCSYCGCAASWAMAARTSRASRRSMRQPFSLRAASWSTSPVTCAGRREGVASGSGYGQAIVQAVRQAGSSAPQASISSGWLQGKCLSQTQPASQPRRSAA